MTNTVETLYGTADAAVFEMAKDIKLLICDVDGVFSDGRIYMGNNGERPGLFHLVMATALNR